MAPAGAAEQDAPPTDCGEAQIGRIAFLSHGIHYRISIDQRNG